MEIKYHTKEVCVFCRGTGIAKCFNFATKENIPNGTYSLNALIEAHGEYTKCPEGCQILN